LIKGVVMSRSILLSRREVKEIYRKSVHISSLVLPLSYRYIFGYDRKLTIMVIFPLAFAAVIVELIRLEHRTVKRIFYRVFGIMMRKHEIANLTGASYLLTSTVFCIALFPKEIAFAALSFLALGDTFAAVFGIRFGRRKLINSYKSLEGSIACFAICLSYALIFQLHPVIALTGAFSATFAEMSRIPIDDNVKMPIISGIVMTITSIFVPLTMT
jgi:dolichol kinase